MPRTSFDVSVPSDIESGQTLLVGFSHLGMAALTAVDYIVRHRPSEKIGHISPEEMPVMTPFEDGRPRHSTRLYNLTDVDLTVLVGELFVPVWAARSFSDSLLDWVAANRIEEIAILHGVPFPHGPEEHRVFYVASDEYRDRRLLGSDIDPLKGGFLDGVTGELLGKSLDGDIPPVGVYITPTHPPGPDIDAALHFLDAVEKTFAVEVARKELEQRLEELKQHYANLANRLTNLEEEEQSRGQRDFPDDMMFM